MVLREFGRAAAWLLMVFALLAALTLLASRAVYAAMDLEDPTAIHAEELQGFLPNQGDTHYLGLETAGVAKTIVLTLKAWTPQGLSEMDAVGFVVLAEDGLQAVMEGADLQDAALVQGRTLRTTSGGVIARAVVPAGVASGYTVVVWNRSAAPVSYALAARNGTLIDGAGQTEQASPSWQDKPYPLVAGYAQTATLTEEQVFQAAPEFVRDTLPGASASSVMAYRISGSLYQLYDRHFLDLVPIRPDAEISVHMTYDTGFQAPPDGKVNFWVLTKSGLLQMMQGALPTELNLATGQAVEDGKGGVMKATLRLGGEGPYTLVVFNDSTTPAAYTLTVEGAVLVDTFVQTNEAKAAAAEVAAEKQASSPATNTLAVLFRNQ